jgi:hypothetical protein
VWTKLGMPRGCLLGVRRADGPTINFLGFKEKVRAVQPLRVFGVLVQGTWESVCVVQQLQAHVWCAGADGVPPPCGCRASCRQMQRYSAHSLTA